MSLGQKIMDILEDPRTEATVNHALDRFEQKVNTGKALVLHRIRRANRRAQINVKLRRDYGVWESKILQVDNDPNLDDQEYASKLENEIASVGLDGWEPYQVSTDLDGAVIFLKRYTVD